MGIVLPFVILLLLALPWSLPRLVRWAHPWRHHRRYRRYQLPLRPRPHDPRERRYALAPATQIVPVSLAAVRSLVKDQGQIGSCVAHAVTSAAEMCGRIAQQKNPPLLNRLWLYAKTRMAEHTFPQDAGSVPADACDIALTGVPAEALWPYVADAGRVPPASLDADAPRHRWVDRHAPIYGPDAQSFVAGISTALAARCPVALALLWHSDWFNLLPRAGVAPVRGPQDQTHPGNCLTRWLRHRLFGARGVVGGHAIHVWAVQVLSSALTLPNGETLPAGETLVWCRNSWGTAYTDAGVHRVNPEAQPGDFALPLAVFDTGMILDVRAVVPVAAPLPDPPPAPPLTVSCWRVGPDGQAAPQVDHHVTTTATVVVIDDPAPYFLRVTEGTIVRSPWIWCAPPHLPRPEVPRG